MRVINNRLLLKCLFGCNQPNYHSCNGSLNYSTSRNIFENEKSHPYYKIHPWRTKNQFISDMLNQILYNKDGLVAINKPYGISSRPDHPRAERKKFIPSGIPFEVDYTLSDTLPAIAEKLGYKALTIIKTPDKYMTGVVLLSASKKITEAIDKSMKRAQGMKIIPKTYWAITRRIPIDREGERKVAIKNIYDPTSKRTQPHIVTSWSDNERTQNIIKILNVKFNVLSTSTHDLASLLEIKASTNQNYAIRLFASTVLMSPILGDRIFGSRVQDVMGKYLKISSFVDAASALPRLDKDLLLLLNLTLGKQIIIPVHYHLREMFIPWFLKKNNDITITAPPRDEFIWTCSRIGINEKILGLTQNKSEVDSSDTYTTIDSPVERMEHSV